MKLKINLFFKFQAVHSEKQLIWFALPVNQNYNKILESDWLSTGRFEHSVGQCNWTVHVMPCVTGQPTHHLRAPVVGQLHFYLFMYLFIYLFICLFIYLFILLRHCINKMIIK